MAEHPSRNTHPIVGHLEDASEVGHAFRVPTRVQVIPQARLRLNPRLYRISHLGDDAGKRWIQQDHLITEKGDLDILFPVSEH